MNDFKGYYKKPIKPKPTPIKDAVSNFCLNGMYILVPSFIIWVFVGSMVFAFRHPWATDTERFIYAYEAMTFQKVPYNQMRPRE